MYCVGYVANASKDIYKDFLRAVASSAAPLSASAKLTKCTDTTVNGKNAVSLTFGISYVPDGSNVVSRIQSTLASKVEALANYLDVTSVSVTP